MGSEILREFAPFNQETLTQIVNLELDVILVDGTVLHGVISKIKKDCFVFKNGMNNKKIVTLDSIQEITRRC